MVQRRFLIVLLFVLTLVTGACTSDDAADQKQLPDAAALLRDSAAATSEITSTHFTLAVTGEVPGLTVRSVDGDLTKEGSAQGTVTLMLGGQLVEGKFVLAGDTLYLDAGTGGYQQIPAAMITSVYDPSGVLDPERGIAKLLGNVRDAKTVAAEDVNGTPSYKITGTVAKDVIAGLVPGIDSDANMTLWLAEDGKHLPVKATAALPAAGGEPPTVDVTLSDVNKPVTVTPPQ